ncbi:MAG TPA: hypothetical protein VFA97_04165 [Gaiellaceae bacterium]|nr:hypothetical protein [Gaiellaceae bacterium]
MRLAATVVAALLVPSAFVAAAWGGQTSQPTIRFGVADDTGKYAPDGGSAFFAQLASIGLDEDRMTVLWDASHPTTITESTFLDRSIAQAVKDGIDIRLAIRPARANGIGLSAVRAREFGTFTALVAKRYPQVHTFVIGNEPNQPRFWQPQYVKGKAVAAQGYEQALADSYDDLKAVDPTIVVIGGVLSSRGNDDAAASTNASRSPLRFIHDLGLAYAKSKRTKPLMDEFGFHAYPRSNRDSLARGLQWPGAGFSNLARIKQALWDAFGGSAQPTVETGLRISIDEVGWQTAIPAASKSSYTGLENVPVTSDAVQAKIYGQIIADAACDPSIADVLFAPFVDESQLGGFQSGLVRADGTLRPSYAVVQNALANGGPRCHGARVRWQHSTTVSGARVFFGSASAVHWRYQKVWSFAVRAGEDATYRASIVPVSGRGVLSVRAALRAHPVLSARGLAKANWTPLVRFPARRLNPGRYAYVVTLTAALAPARHRVFVSRTFVVH